MLFSYTYVPHSMETMQGYIDYIFHNVWCTARGNDYDIEALFAGNNELRELIAELHTSEKKGADFFLTGLQQIFEDFKHLSNAQLNQLKQWFHSNNNIEQACAGDPAVTPATYAVVAGLSGALSAHLRAFFKNLYSQSFLSLKSIKDRIGEIDNHYHSFMETNKQGKCPFCGIQDVKGIYHSKREAYDHFLPKDKYPFNSINFHNLVPTCHECNSSYKLSIDPLFNTTSPLLSNAGRQRKAFYPYSNNPHNIELEISLIASDWTHITPDDIQLNIGPNAIKEEIDTWLDVYGIDERYKAKCCGENDGKAWIVQILDEWKEDGRNPVDFLSTLERLAKRQPYCDDNFLKKPFLEACKNRGLFN